MQYSIYLVLYILHQFCSCFSNMEENAFGFQLFSSRWEMLIKDKHIVLWRQTYDTFRNIQHTCHMTSVTNSNRHMSDKKFEHIGNNGGRKHTYIIYTSKYCQFMIMDFLKNRTPSQCFGYRSASAAVLTKNILLFHTSTELIKICAVIFSKNIH